MICKRWHHCANGDRQAVLLALPITEQPTPGSLKRLRHEFELKDDLDDAWAARPRGLVHEQGQIILVLKDPGGEPLDRFIGPAHGARTALSAALGRLHERGLVHQDIKPSNVPVNSASGQIWLTGFGIASRLPRERQSPDPAEFIAGILAYMAPEQTGRMNHSIDSRCDLYSFGVMLYQLLTGNLPFTATDQREGFMKVLVGHSDDHILGFAMIGAAAGEVMAVVQTAMLAGLSYPNLANADFAHPTMAEGLSSLFSGVPPRGVQPTKPKIAQ